MLRIILERVTGRVLGAVLAPFAALWALAAYLASTLPLMADTHPYTTTITAPVDAVAGGADDDQTIARAPYAGTLTAAQFIADANLVGADTNSRTLSIVNKGQDGNGNVVMASKAFTAAVNANDFDETALTLSVVAGATTVAEGDVIAYRSTHVGTGIADPGGTVRLTITRA